MIRANVQAALLFRQMITSMFFFSYMTYTQPENIKFSGQHCQMITPKVKGNAIIRPGDNTQVNYNVTILTNINVITQPDVEINVIFFLDDCHLAG
jgi:hypothetical protein